MLLPDGRVLITGGEDLQKGGTPTASAELFDPRTGTFSPTGSMTTARRYPTATLLPDGHVLIAGGGNVGADGGFHPVASAELYDPASGTFRLTGSMSMPRAVHTTTLLPSGEVLIAGGYHSVDQDPVLATTELYDPRAGSFTSAGLMTTARYFQTATLLSNGQVLIAGGVPDAFASAVASASSTTPRPGCSPRPGP